MATWTVNTTADDGSVDTVAKTGSLRGIIGAATNGDKIVFDATAFPEETETSIYLSSQLALPDIDLEIDGGETWTVPYVWRDVDGTMTQVYIDDNNPARTGETVLQRLKTRVVLDRQELGRVVYKNSANELTIRGLTFKNGSGSNSSGVGAGVYFNRTSENSVINCVFQSCNTVASGAGIYAALSAKIAIENCCFDDCDSSGSSSNAGGAIALTNSSEATILNTTFDKCGSSGFGGAISANSEECFVSGCDFNYCAASVGGGAARIVTSATFSNCTFNRCNSIYSNSSSGGAIRIDGGSGSFTSCVFNQCEAPYGDALYGINDATATFNRCMFIGKSGERRGFICDASASPKLTLTMTNCVAYGNGAGSNYASVVNLFASTSTAHFIYCTFGNNLTGVGEFRTADLSKISLSDSLIGMNVTFANVGFVDNQNNDFRLAPGSSYLSGGTWYQSGDVDYLGHPRKANGAVGAYAGSWFVVAANGTATISANVSADYADIGNGATITFSGTDRILAITSGATIGTATLQNAANSSGYLAVPSGTDLTSATFSGVKASTYGAGASGFSATLTSGTTASLSWTQTGIAPVLLEIQDGAAWTTISASATSPYTATAAPIFGKTFRIFDGENFLTAITPKDPNDTGFYRINDWAALNWNITSWVDVTNGGDGGRDGECAFTVSNWAIDPEINED